MVTNECDFEREGFCCPPKEYAGFVCPDSECKNGFLYCNGSNDSLFTEEEYERMFGEVVRGLSK